MGLEMEPIVDRGDSSNHSVAGPGQEQLDVGVLEERVFGRRQPLAFTPPQGCHPVRVVGVPMVRMVDEPGELAASVDRPDADTCHADIIVHTPVWTSERLAIGYFVYLAVVCWLRPLPIRRRVALAAIASFEIAAIWWIAARDILFLRQWAPLPTILIGYYASGLLFVAPSPAIEAWLMAWDRRLLGDPSRRFAQWPRPVLAALEIAYMGCFVLIGGGLLILLLNGHAAAADYYWTLVIGAEFGAFAPLAFVQTRPPWAIERKPVLADPVVHDLATQMVKVFTIHVNTFPSGHVAGSLAVAFAVAATMPMVGALLIVLALIISVATVVGRYHYVLDGIAGMLLALVLWAIVNRL